MRAVVVATLLTGVLVAGCGREETPSTGVAIVRVRLAHGEVRAGARQVAVAVGQPIRLVVTSSSADQIHLHSEPEGMLRVPAGATRVLRFRLPRPGVYDVESHERDTVLVRLEAR